LKPQSHEKAGSQFSQYQTEGEILQEHRRHTRGKYDTDSDRVCSYINEHIDNLLRIQLDGSISQALQDNLGKKEMS
jgi:hypothetical protein